jgi:hypothetical protein
MLMPQTMRSASNQQGKWHKAMLDFAGTCFVLMGLGIGLLTLRLILVLAHGTLH